MDRLVTIVSTGSGATADVRIAADGTTLADVHPELCRLTGGEASPVSRAGVRLDPHEPVAHLRDGDVLVLGAAAAPEQAEGVHLEVIGGPDAGRSITLAPGRHLLGRGTPPLFSTDPLVSREHLDVVVAPDGGITMTDLDSPNGTRIDGHRLAPAVASPWPAGGVVRIGDTAMTHGRDAASASLVPGPGGTTVVNRAPRIADGATPLSIEFPPPPARTEAGRAPVLASIAPLAAGLLLAVVIRRWEFLAFAVMSPLVVLAQWASDRWRARQSDRRSAAAHAQAIATAEHALSTAVSADARRRHAASPDLPALVRAATDRTSLLWHRGIDDDDALTLRVGTGSAPAHVVIKGHRLVPSLDDVPICVDLRGRPMLGICGPDKLATAVARSLVAQAATLLGPGALQIRVLAPGRSSAWSWTRWLPHLRRSPDQPAGLTVTAGELRAAFDDLRSGDPRTHRLVVVDGVHDASMAAALAECVDTAVLWLAATESALPSVCEEVISIGGSPARAALRGATTADDVVPDVLDADLAESVARALCPLRDSVASASAIPSEVRWSSLHHLRLEDGAEATATALARRWRSGPTSAACLGVTADAPYVVDLDRDGPHMLVAGTTGSGKSELLQTLVASLVAVNSPTDLALLLVDYKGGAAFGPCTTLPHTVGVLTDLDPASTTRAIESLSAELRRRERVLAAAGVPDLDRWRLRAANSDEHLPRLVIVVDEFATLAEDLPDFIGGLVGIAQRGRSLGVHLVLATQRPEGAVSADIRANVRLRVCLAVARETESRDVIDGPQALSISRTTPGRALVRLGSCELIEMQTARVAGHLPVERSSLVRIVAPGAADTTPASADSPTELDVLVEAATRAARLTGARIATPPWLSPLPEQVALSELLAGATDAEAVPIGLVDLPHVQCQPPLTLERRSADPLLFVGGARSGRTTAVLTVATSLAATSSPDRLHIWAIDSGSGLAALANLPHTGAVVDVRDNDRLERLVCFLVEEVERRRAAVRDEEPSLLLVVDSWEGLGHATADADAGRSQDLLLRLVTEGPGVGLRVVMTADRSGLTGRVGSAFSEHICLRLPDRSDYALLGLPPRQVPRDLPPGRGLRSGADVALVQLAAPDVDAIAAAARWPAPATPARRFDSLPARVPLHSLPRQPRDVVVVGLRGDDLTTVCVDPAETGGSLLVAGPPRSGRSTALVSIATQLQDRPVVAVCARRGPLHRRRDLAVVVDGSNADEVRAAIAAADHPALLVDDVDLLDDAGVLDAIEAAVRAARDGRGFVVLAGATDAMAAMFRGPVAQARRARAGLLLRPEGPHDGELLGLRLRRRPGHTDPPGRGFLAIHGTALPVQVADPG